MVVLRNDYVQTAVAHLALAVPPKTRCYLLFHCINHPCFCFCHIKGSEFVLCETLSFFDIHIANVESLGALHSDVSQLSTAVAKCRRHFHSFRGSGSAVERGVRRCCDVWSEA